MSSYYKFTWLCVIGMLFSVGSVAQSIKGTVTDSTGKPVPYANINLKNDSNLIIAYAISNSKGDYALPTPAGTKPPLQAEVSCMGFKKQSKTITDFSVPLNVVLSPEIIQLKTFILKVNLPLLPTRCDTLILRV